MLEIEPTAGTTDQVTAVLELPLTEALNCVVCPALSEDEVGVTVTTSGTRETAALADWVEFAALVAITVIFC